MIDGGLIHPDDIDAYTRLMRREKRGTLHPQDAAPPRDAFMAALPRLGVLVTDIHSGQWGRALRMGEVLESETRQCWMISVFGYPILSSFAENAIDTDGARIAGTIRVAFPCGGTTPSGEPAPWTTPDISIRSTARELLALLLPGLSEFSPTVFGGQWNGNTLARWWVVIDKDRRALEYGETNYVEWDMPTIVDRQIGALASVRIDRWPGTPVDLAEGEDVDRVLCGIPIPDPTPLPRGAIVSYSLHAGFGYVITSTEDRKFDPRQRDAQAFPTLLVMVGGRRLAANDSVTFDDQFARERLPQNHRVFRVINAGERDITVDFAVLLASTTTLFRIVTNLEPSVRIEPGDHQDFDIACEPDPATEPGTYTQYVQFANSSPDANPWRTALTVKILDPDIDPGDAF